MSKGLKILVVGPGCVGLGLGALLQRQGAQVFVWSRRESSEFSLRHSTISLAVDFAVRENGHLWRAEFQPAAIDASTPISAILIVTKSYDFLAALQAIEHFPAQIPLIGLANGFIWNEAAVWARKHNKILRWGVVTSGFRWDSSASLVIQRNPLGTIVGSLVPDESIASPNEIELMNILGDMHWVANIEDFCRRKWFANTVINSLCGALRVMRNGDLLAHKELLFRVSREAFDLGEEIWGEGCFKIPLLALFEHVLAVINGTKENENSMVRDIRLGRRTESSSLAGLAMRREGYPLLKDFHRACEKSVLFKSS